MAVSYISKIQFIIHCVYFSSLHDISQAQCPLGGNSYNNPMLKEYKKVYWNKMCVVIPSISQTIMVLCVSVLPLLSFSLQTMQAARCPTDELSLTNCAVVSEKDLQSGQ